MGRRDLIAVGASAGGVEALRQLVASLPPSFDGTLLVVLHVPPHGGSVLPNILSRAGSLTARHAESVQPIPTTGTILVAPPDFHMIVDGDKIRLSHGPRLNAHRPAIDPLFYSLARSRGEAAVGVILSGTLDDGASGLQAIRRRGGIAIVQDPREAVYPMLPNSAVRAGRIDHVAPVAKISAILVDLLDQELPPPNPLREASEASGILSTPAERQIIADILGPRAGQVEPQDASSSPFTCPECQGALAELRDGQLVRYRCGDGHTFSSDALYEGQHEKLEEALWAAYRALQENEHLCERLAARAESRGLLAIGQRHRRLGQNARERADVIHRVLERGIVEGQPEDSRPLLGEV